MAPSLNPNKMAAGGFFPEGFYRFQNTRYVLWDYDGQRPEAEALFLRAELVPSEGGETRTQYWRLADKKDFVPTADGRGTEQVGRRTEFLNSTNGAELTKSLLNAGYPEDKLTDDPAEVFDGLEAYMILQDAPERQGMAPQVDPQTGAVRKQQIVVVAEIKTLPGAAPKREAAPAGPPSARGRATSAVGAVAASGRGGAASRNPSAPIPPGTAAAAAPAPVNGSGPSAELKEEVAAFIMGRVAEGPVERGVLTTMAMREYGSSPNRGQIVGLLNNKGFIDGLVEEGMLALEGTAFSLPA